MILTLGCARIVGGMTATDPNYPEDGRDYSDDEIWGEDCND